MGKLFLAGVLALALMPVSLVGLPNKGQKFAQEAAQVESKMEGSLREIQENAGTNCAFDLNGKKSQKYQSQINSLNKRRRNEWRRHGLGTPAIDFPVCGDSESYGYGS